MDSESRSFFSRESLFIITCALIIVNLAVLDIAFIKNFQTKTILEESSDNKPSLTPPINQSLQKLQEDASCPSSCLSKINEATSSIKLVPTNSAQKPQPNLSDSGYSSVKEFFVPFGSGSNSTDDWADVSGLQAYIDSASYGRIKSVTFEATVRIPTGNETAYVRLFNLTDKHPVWFSEVSLEGGTAKLLTSKPITLDSGNKLYQVQMKTSLKYPAILDQVRLHIITY